MRQQSASRDGLTSVLRPWAVTDSLPFLNHSASRYHAGLLATLLSSVPLLFSLPFPRLPGLGTLPPLALRGSYRPRPRSVPSSSFITLAAVDWLLARPILQVDQRRYSTRHISATRLLTPTNPGSFRSCAVLKVSVAHLVSATPPARPNSFIQRFRREASSWLLKKQQLDRLLQARYSRGFFYSPLSLRRLLKQKGGSSILWPR